MSGKILVTGAPGNVGTELVRALAGMGADVRVLVHHVEKSGVVSHPGIEILQGDMSDESAMRTALDGVQTLYLSSSVSDDQVRVQGTAIDAAVKAGVRWVVKLSAHGAAEGSPVPFLGWHWATERKLRESGLSWTLIRPHLYMQTLLMNIPTIHQKGAIFNSGAGARIPFNDASDVAAASAAIITTEGHDGAIYELSGSAALTWAEVASAISAVIDREIKYVAIPADAYAAALTEAGMPTWLVTGLVELQAYYEREAPPVTDTIHRLTGRQPRTLADFLKDFAPAFSQEHPARV